MGRKTKQKRSASVAVKAEQTVEPSALMPRASSEDWIARIGRLQDALAICPTDILARCELAMLLEKLGQPEEALCHWNAVLACDPNSLKAREGVARCRQRTGRPLQSAL
ncbi:MAG: tetratricopeptide repeat protein [Nitrospirota bacterium]|nr:tetratricopeptide repeat protein [Nitrospirota bacterium]